jgi:hypothetical protein
MVDIDSGMKTLVIPTYLLFTGNPLGDSRNGGSSAILKRQNCFSDENESGHDNSSVEQMVFVQKGKKIMKFKRQRQNSKNRGEHQ